MDCNSCVSKFKNSYFHYQKTEFCNSQFCLNIIGPLQDPVTWYGINYAGTQITQWDVKTKESGTGKGFFVVKAPRRYLPLGEKEAWIDEMPHLEVANCTSRGVRWDFRF